MSSYGPPPGPGPGYVGPEYEPPTDPWEGPAAPPSRFPETPPPPEPPRGPSIGLYATVAVLVVLAAAGVGYALYLLSGDTTTPVSAGDPSGTPPASPGSSPLPTQDNLGMAAVMARVGDCLVNDGSEGDPQLRIVPCDPEAPGDDPAFEVLAVIPERVDEGQEDAQAQALCENDERYTHHYYEVGADADFVLCMAALESD